ncbi:hypothetical protein B9Z55_015785 [Caenorhabditis nigoni]|uniref:Sdz-33 F-box domain-containing protein n=1 Tax=Caenorhabditis nigoni TaxID=1611254 RepID=A0A2G5UCC2_9PELO|nr:hypothetical protein B9Z55_015785 [Caenorhabditis nigoni]
MPFPILRAPFVVQSEIISLLEPNEIVTASFCSKKVKHFLKGHYQQRKPLEWRLIMVDCDSYGHVDIMTSKNAKKIPVIGAEDFSELDKSIPIPPDNKTYVATFDTEHSCPVIYLRDRVMAVQWIVKYVTDLFNLDIYGLEVDGEGIWAIDWIKNRQEKMLDRFVWYGDEAAMDHVLRNARASDYYILDGDVSQNFQFDGNLGPANHFLTGLHGHWVTINNLTNFDFESIVVRRCRLSVPDLYAFIGHWRSGGSPRLTFLRLEFDNQLDFEHFENELEVVKRDISGEYRLDDGENWSFNHGYSIQRDGGVKAVIDIDEDNCYFVMMVCFGEDIYDRDNYSKKNSDQQFVLHQNV